MNEDIQLLNEIIEEIRHKLRRKEICARYRKNNKDKVAESRRKYAKNHREKILIRQRTRRENVRLRNGLEKFHRPLNKNSPFVRVYNNVKNSRHRCLVTIDDIREQYQKQNGMCALSGLKLATPKHSGITCKTPDMVSVDRIDSTKPYTKHNIQLVCVALNYAKNDFTDTEIREFVNKMKTS